MTRAVFLAVSAVLLARSSAIGQTSTEPPAVERIAEAPDPFQWLEDFNSARALAWVKAEDAKTQRILESDSRFPAVLASASQAMQVKDRIPRLRRIGERMFEVAQDAAHPRGIWRWTRFADFAAQRPTWRIALDLDALDKAEKIDWSLKDVNCRPPAYTRCLLGLSNGGDDATEVREFDLASNAFVVGGLRLPRSRQMVDWLDADTAIVAQDWGPGTVARSGYPLVIKTLRRGERLDQARTMFRGDPSDLAAEPFVLHDGQGHEVVLIERAKDFFHTQTYALAQGHIVRLWMPEHASLRGLLHGKLVFTVEEDWTFGGQHIRAGSLVAARPEDLADQPNADAVLPYQPLVFQPGSRQSIREVATTRNRLVVSFLDTVRGRLAVFDDHGARGWVATTLPVPDNAFVDITAPGPGIGAPNIWLWTTGAPSSDRLFFRVSDFLNPVHLWQADAVTGAVSDVKGEAGAFDPSGYVTEQFEAISSDGTKIPYFIVHLQAMKLDGSNPTLIWAYGGWGYAQPPFYDRITGKIWFERGGVFVLANIRGGSEFGPAWHDLAIKTHRQLVHDDLAAVARDLIARKITSPHRLGIEGSSAGGELMGVEFTQHPELFNAVSMEFPVLDLLNFERMGQGAGVGEWGSAAVPEERAFLAKTSPYNNLKRDVRYPPAFLLTNTKDERAGPGHARKFAARLSELGSPYFFYEPAGGGHGGGEAVDERARTRALIMTYFIRQLMN